MKMKELELSNQKCYYCEKTMKYLGGILFSPPTYNNKNMVYKHHVCRGCYNAITREPRQRDFEKEDKK